jgi:hypothetical protein
MSRRAPAALAVLSLLAAPAWSQFTAEEFKSARQDPKMYTLDEHSIKVVRVGPPPERAPEQLRTGPSISDIVNTGLQVWKIIEANKPVVNIATQFATALPKGAKNWTDMAQWKPPIGTEYRLSAKNMYGVTVVDVQYQILRTYGGSFDGKGLYLTNVTVSPMPEGVSVLWGYRFSLTTTVPDSGIVNVGTAAAPIAGMTVQTAWRITTVLKDSQGQGTYFVEGNGNLREITGPAEALKRARAATAAASAAAARKFD